MGIKYTATKNTKPNNRFKRILIIANDSQFMKSIIYDLQTSSELQNLNKNIHKIVKPVFAFGRSQSDGSRILTKCSIAIACQLVNDTGHHNAATGIQYV